MVIQLIHGIRLVVLFSVTAIPEANGPEIPETDRSFVAGRPRPLVGIPYHQLTSHIVLQRNGCLQSLPLLSP
jgi:hypothetical protein